MVTSNKAVILTCTITGVLHSPTVVWSGGDISGSLSASNSDYTLESGEFNFVENSVVHKLTISPTALKSVQPETVFTCRFTEGLSKPAEATHTLKVFTPGELAWAI